MLIRIWYDESVTTTSLVVLDSSSMTSSVFDTMSPLPSTLFFSRLLPLWLHPYMIRCLLPSTLVFLGASLSGYDHHHPYLVRWVCYPSLLFFSTPGPLTELICIWYDVCYPPLLSVHLPYLSCTWYDGICLFLHLSKVQSRLSTARIIVQSLNPPSSVAPLSHV